MPDHSTRILLVDDDRFVRSELNALLGREGYLVELATTAIEGLDALEKSPPDMVLIHLCMPTQDGIELCRAMRELCPDLPVIIIASLADMASAVAALRAGAEDYLTQPLAPEAVLLSIQRAIARRAAKVERQQLRLHAESLQQQTISAVQAHQNVLSIVSHDLRNPLGIIMMGAQQIDRLAAKHEHGKGVQAIAATIVRNSKHMERLIADLLDESRIRTGHLHIEREMHALSNLLGDISELRPLAQQRRIAINVITPTLDRSLGCDRMRINQLLGNLIANAIKFNPENSTVTVYAEPTKEGVQFSVQDQGPGISRQAQAQMFHPFWQAQGGSRTGVGLGLYIAQGIVEAHKGRIWVESQLGIGSTFHVYIPDRPAPERRLAIQKYAPTIRNATPEHPPAHQARS